MSDQYIFTSADKRLDIALSLLTLLSMCLEQSPLSVQQSRPALFHHPHTSIDGDLCTASIIPDHDWDCRINVAIIDFLP
jgi:hypothetical protein